MKFISKIKRLFQMLGIAIALLPYKIVRAFDMDSTIQALYGPPQELNSTQSNGLWNILKVIIIPIILIIGLIIYFRKSKGTFKKKILISLIIIIFTLLIVFILNKII